jgi:hypothetical protein
VTLYQGAAAEFAAVSLPMHAAIARQRLGALVGGEAGRAHQMAAAEWFQREEILDPERFARTLVA